MYLSVLKCNIYLFIYMVVIQAVIEKNKTYIYIYIKIIGDKQIKSINYS